MTALGYWQAALLGVVQGLTEFLPVSSSAHLALTQKFLGLDPSSTSILLFDMVTHLGTLGAIAWVFAHPIRRFVLRLRRELASTWQGRPRHALRILGLAVTATIPTGVIGLLFQETFEAAFGNSVWIGVELSVTGALLMVAAFFPPTRGRWRDFRWWHAAIVGLAQAVAIFPGISRSGATICAATFCGLRRRWAAEFSFLISFPAILGAFGVKMKDMAELPREQFLGTPWGPILLGGVVACLVGAGAVIMLVSMVRRARLHYFSWYCWLLGGLAILGFTP